LALEVSAAISQQSAPREQWLVTIKSGRTFSGQKFRYVAHFSFPAWLTGVVIGFLPS